MENANRFNSWETEYYEDALKVKTFDYDTLLLEGNIAHTFARNIADAICDVNNTISCNIR